MSGKRRKKNPSLWETSVALATSQEDIQRAIARVPQFPGGYEGQGITICGGGYKYFTNAYILVRLLRHLDCQLPIQLWHLNAAEITKEMRQLLAPYDIECVNAAQVQKIHPVKNLAGWALKPYSILYSPFKEVLAIDADNFPVRNPSYLFGEQDYRMLGAVFWPDRGATPQGASIWSVSGIHYRDEPEFESGQIVVNKELCWEPLNLTMWMNANAEFFYRHIYRDKDTFRFAWHIYGRVFAMPPYALEELTVKDGGHWGVMCQHDFQGRRLFQHRSLHKWDLIQSNPHVPGFIHDNLCRSYLHDLRRSWTGRNEETQDWLRKRSLQQAIKELCGETWLLDDRREACCPNVVGKVNICLPGSEPDSLELRPRWLELRFASNGTICKGSHDQILFWNVGKTDKGYCLELRNARGVTARLRQGKGKKWIGVWIRQKRRTSIVIRRLIDVYPTTERIRSTSGYTQRNVASRHLSITLSAMGIGDAVCAVYACTAAARAGHEVTFFSRHASWLSRVNEPRLTIIDAAPPGDAIDLMKDYVEDIRYGYSKAHWYVYTMGISRPPVRPRMALEADSPPVEHQNYVVFAPVAASNARNWLACHWQRLASMCDASGYAIIAIGSEANSQVLSDMFINTTVYWKAGGDPDWVVRLLLGSRCIVGLDSGMSHLGGLLNIPTIAIHSQLPPDYLWQCTKVVSVAPSTSCASCRWQFDKGFNETCGDACSALATINPEIVHREIAKVVIKPDES